MSAPNQTCHGIYKCGEREGLLYEPVPKPTSPYVDDEVDVNNFPFMTFGSHVKVNPLTGASRTVVLDDTPGIALLYFYDPANPSGRHKEMVSSIGRARAAGQECLRPFLAGPCSVGLGLLGSMVKVIQARVAMT